MATRRLYIIGNGFDRHHGIASDYNHFAAYLRAADPPLFDMIERYFPADRRFWSSFETGLADFDVDGAVDYAAQFLDDKGYGDFQYELQQIAEGLSERLPMHFAAWVRGLVIPERAAVAAPLAIDAAARFLTFNYTPTLERLYDVPPEHILYIHGRAADPTARLILGHGWERSDAEQLSAGEDGPDDDWRVREGLAYLDDFLNATLKPTAEILERERPFFTSLADIEEVLILGHGLHAVDAPYLHAVVAGVDRRTTRWSVSIRGDDQAERQRLFSAYGVPPHLVRYLPMTAL